MKNRMWNVCVHVAVVFSAMAVASCALVSKDPSPGSDPGALQPGTVSLTNNPLVAQYSISAPPSSDVEIEFGPDKTYGQKTWLQPAPAGGGTVSILVAGMRAATTYHMRARVRVAFGREFVDSEHTFTTGAIAPGRLPPLPSQWWLPSAKLSGQDRRSSAGRPGSSPSPSCLRSRSARC